MPAGTTECLDQDGNLALNAWFNAPTTELNVQNRFTVEMLRENPFDYVIVGESLHLPLWYREPLSAALASYRNDAHVAEPVRQLANAVAAGSQQNALTFLLALSQQILQSCRQVIRPTGAPWPSHETLRRRESSCRDLAVLFCDACRAMGIAARFVSGYECASANNSNPYMHEWAESICQALAGGATIHPADWRFPTATLPWPLDSIPNSRPRSPAGISAGPPRTWKRRSACTWIAPAKKIAIPLPAAWCIPSRQWGDAKAIAVELEERLPVGPWPKVQPNLCLSRVLIYRTMSQEIREAVLLSRERPKVIRNTLHLAFLQ